MRLFGLKTKMLVPLRVAYSRARPFDLDRSGAGGHVMQNVKSIKEYMERHVDVPSGTTKESRQTLGGLYVDIATIRESVRIPFLPWESDDQPEIRD